MRLSLSKISDTPPTLVLTTISPVDIASTIAMPNDSVSEVDKNMCPLVSTPLTSSGFFLPMIYILCGRLEIFFVRNAPIISSSK